MRYAVFTILTFLSVLPLSPMLAKMGMEICPIIESHGFWKGCELNIKFIFTLWVSIVMSGLAAFSFQRWSKMQLKWIHSSVLTGLGFLVINIALVYYMRGQIAHSLAGLGSPYSGPISAVLLVAGSAVVFLAGAILDLLSISAEGGPSRASNRFEVVTSELWNQFLQIFPLAFVSVTYLVFTIEVFDAQAEGWSTFADQKNRLSLTLPAMGAWLLIYSVILTLLRQAGIRKLVFQARQLKNLTPGPPMDVNRMGLLSQVGEALNQSARLLHEKARLVSGFSKFVTDRLLDRVLNSESIDLHGHQVECALMMTDLRGFTQISSTLRPTQVVELLNIYFEEMIGVLSRNDILLDKFIGDGILAYLPAEGSISSAEACAKMQNAAAEMIQRLPEINRRLSEAALPPIELGIGLHFGSTVLGAIGSTTRMQFTVIGDSVNKVARLEALCKELETNLVVSEAFFGCLGLQDRKIYEKPRKSYLKGFKNEEIVYTRGQTHRLSAA